MAPAPACSPRLHGLVLLATDAEEGGARHAHGGQLVRRGRLRLVSPDPRPRTARLRDCGRLQLGLRRRLRPRRYSARLPPAPPLPLLFCRRPLRPSPRGRVAVRPARCDPEARCQPPPQPQRRPAPECCFLRCTRQPTEQPLARPHAARSPAGNSGLGPAAKRRIAWRAAGRDPAEEPQGYSLAGRLAARCGSGGGHPVGHVAGGQGAAGAAVRRVHVGHGRAVGRPVCPCNPCPRLLVHHHRPDRRRPRALPAHRLHRRPCASRAQLLPSGCPLAGVFLLPCLQATGRFALRNLRRPLSALPRPRPGRVRRSRRPAAALHALPLLGLHDTHHHRSRRYHRGFGRQRLGGAGRGGRHPVRNPRLYLPQRQLHGADATHDSRD
mmetsp:Transcript_16776/g.54617  ORF Transcript_16776/g.54617 Transcript_16776/m.54617 type:complete len:382 (+) Transcript_16776:351-1496(+)